ncbi:MAG: hypothetical protein ABW039_05975 [Sphingobium sp.]
METPRKYRAGSSDEGAQGRFMTIGLPMPHEGVGNALRTTFRPVRDTLPDDMLALLARLDRH